MRQKLLPTRRIATGETPCPAGLIARGLGRSFAGRDVLRDVDLRLEPGRVGLVLGANGAGKTTLLRVFATLLRPDRGVALVDGLDPVADGHRVRERIGVALVNERSLYWRLSVRENLRLFARTRGVPERELDAQIAGLLTELDLGETTERWVADLSAGQRQRVILARAALGRPTTLLIDEPLRGLDEQGLEAATGFLRSRADAGATVLVVAPVAAELGPVADELMRIEAGRLVSPPGP